MFTPTYIHLSRPDGNCVHNIPALRIGNLAVVPDVHTNGHRAKDLTFDEVEVAPFFSIYRWVWDNHYADKGYWLAQIVGNRNLEITLWAAKKMHKCGLHYLPLIDRVMKLEKRYPPSRAEYEWIIRCSVAVSSSLITDFLKWHVGQTRRVPADVVVIDRTANEYIWTATYPTVPGSRTIFIHLLERDSYHAWVRWAGSWDDE